MKTVTATELARNFSALLDQVEHRQEVLVVVRNRHVVARVVPGPATMTAVEAMAPLHRSLSDEAGATWLSDARSAGRRLEDGTRDPWAS